MIEISDDGRGFDAVAQNGKGLGLNGMRARVQAIGGQLEIVSTPGKGTTVAATFGRKI